MADTVSTGIYAGFTAVEIAAEREKYKRAVQARTTELGGTGGKTVRAGTFAGQQVEFQQSHGFDSIDQWRLALEDAERQLAGATPRRRNVTIGRL